MEIKLGDIAKDSITGFKGVVVGVTQWLHGCKRIILQPQEMKEGKPVEAQTFDEPQLELVKSRNHQPKTDTGGPRPEAVKQPSASRR